MRKFPVLLSVLFLFICASASTVNNYTRFTSKGTSVNNHLINVSADTVLDYYPFEDSSYVLSVRVALDPDAEDTVLYIQKQSDNKTTVLWKELLSLPEWIEFWSEDFNGDGLEDVLIYGGTGARGANELYYLYIKDPQKHTLVKVPGFEVIPNAQYLPEYNVILSYAYAGKNYFILYRIDKDNVIHQLGDAFEDDPESDSDEFEKQIKTILHVTKEK
ncbi:XAC2610-related protein [Sphingobacterium spiritivorum]|uniref:XAC2610-related protein n=1 Tax=Sphingobacterium spiritivorum TaxID=258 RepID=UPI00191A76DF|nr:hypothetical protein [Sphingobacterium spiritivorum]QQT25023.1 hypothetical protein I6J02_15000 [Sphingobacterium spiritivorum]